ncbi:hypothetical protein MT418_007224 [Batrachochytrium dendrobatidis]
MLSGLTLFNALLLISFKLSSVVASSSDPQTPSTISHTTYVAIVILICVIFLTLLICCWSILKDRVLNTSASSMFQCKRMSNSYPEDSSIEAPPTYESMKLPFQSQNDTGSPTPQYTTLPLKYPPKIHS